MNVLFLAPNYPLEMQDFTRGLAEVGANVVGVGDSPKESLSPKVKQALAGYIQAPLQDGERVLAAARATGVRFDRVECLWEPFVELAAYLREKLDVPGMRLDTARAFRDKELMKQRVERAGLRVPYHFRCRTKEEVIAAVDRIGFPIIIKPIAGAGSADTYRVNDGAELDTVLKRTQHVDEVSVEEFVDGEEFTFDTVCVDGRPATSTSRSTCRARSSPEATSGSAPSSSRSRTCTIPSTRRGSGSASAYSRRSAWAMDSRTWSGTARPTARSSSARSARATAVRTSSTR